MDGEVEIWDSPIVEKMFPRGSTPNPQISRTNRRNHLFSNGSLKIKIGTNSGRFSQVLVVQAAQVRDGDDIS